jgi:hypothetical protein
MLHRFAENLTPNGIQSPTPRASRESLHRLCYAGAYYYYYYYYYYNAHTSMFSRQQLPENAVQKNLYSPKQIKKKKV